MTSEQVPTAPNMIPEQILTAIQIRSDLRDASDALRDQELHHDHYSRYKEDCRMRGEYPPLIDIAGTIRFDEGVANTVHFVKHAIKKHAVNKADRAARKHYSDNEAIYQYQALKDAAAAGVAINGWSQA